MKISYISPLHHEIIHPRSKKVPEIKHPADIFLGKPGINFIETKYMNVVPFASENHDDLFLNLRIFLLFGKCIGLIPIQGLFQGDYEELKYRKSSFPGLLSALIIIALGLNATIGLISMGSGTVDHADDYAWKPAMFTFYGTGTFMYAFFYLHSNEFIGLIYKWNQMTLHFTKPDTSLFRHINTIAALVLTSAILENAVAHLKLFPVVPLADAHLTTSLKEESNATAWEVYFIRSHGQWTNFAPYHIVLAVFLFVCNKLSIYAWNYMDITIMLLARVVYFKFKALYYQGEAILFNEDSISDKSKWRALTKDHETLCSFLYDLNKFLSPLIFISYGINIYYVCLQLNLGLNPSGNTSAAATVYAIWSFLHLITRVYLVSICGARISDWAHRITDLIRKCPNDAYITEVERTERFVNANVIGLNGLGCFVITKPLLLQIVGVVFTFEIVLLQATQTPLLPALGNSTLTPK